MIANNIDGSSSSGSLVDLLALIAGDPKEYQNKLKEMQDVANKNQKYVEAVGPASDILTLRKKAKADTDEAAKILSDAKTEAKSIFSDAQEKAKSLIDTAQDSANTLIENAKSVKSQADAELSAAKQAQAKADNAQSKADAALISATEKSKSLEKAIADAKAVKEDAEATKTDIITKHQNFIQSL